MSTVLSYLVFYISFRFCGPFDYFSLFIAVLSFGICQVFRFFLGLVDAISFSQGNAEQYGNCSHGWKHSSFACSFGGRNKPAQKMYNHVESVDRNSGSHAIQLPFPPNAVRCATPQRSPTVVFWRRSGNSKPLRR